MGFEMLPEIRKYAHEYRLDIDTVLANKVQKSENGICEKCDFTRELYFLPNVNDGKGLKACLGCMVDALAYEEFSSEDTETGIDD